MERDPWARPELPVAESPFEQPHYERLASALETFCSGPTEDLSVTAVTPTDDGYEVEFSRVRSAPDRTELYRGSVTRSGTDEWDLGNVESVAVASTTEDLDGQRLYGVGNLESPLDLTPAETARLEAALRAASEEFETARERRQEYDGYEGAIYYVERVGRDRYAVLFYAKYPQKPGWQWELHGEADRGPDGDWTVGDVAVLEKYNWW